MQSEGGQIHILDCEGGIQTGKDVAQFLSMLMVDAPSIVVLEMTPQSFEADRSEHKQA